MLPKFAKHRANDASHDVHRPPLGRCDKKYIAQTGKDADIKEV